MPRGNVESVCAQSNFSNTTLKLRSSVFRVRRMAENSHRAVGTRIIYCVV